MEIFDCRVASKAARGENGLRRESRRSFVASGNGRVDSGYFAGMTRDARSLLRQVNAEAPVELLGVGEVRLAVARLERSIAFYARTFGFRVVEDSRHAGRGYVIMAAACRARLALYEDRHLNQEPLAGPRHWAYAVGDLDEARASLWDLGVPLAAGSHEPDCDATGTARRSLQVSDPDGHLIELVEFARAEPGPT